MSSNDLDDNYKSSYEDDFDLCYQCTSQEFYYFNPEYRLMKNLFHHERYYGECCNELRVTILILSICIFSRSLGGRLVGRVEG